MNRKQSVFPLIKACSMLVMACGWATLAHAQGPSFNCNKAQTGAERLICQDSKLSQLDRDAWYVNAVAVTANARGRGVG